MPLNKSQPQVKYFKKPDQLQHNEKGLYYENTSRIQQINHHSFDSIRAPIKNDLIATSVNDKTLRWLTSIDMNLHQSSSLQIKGHCRFRAPGH